MAKRRPARRAKTTRNARKRTPPRRSGKRPIKRAKTRRKARAPRKTDRKSRRPVVRKPARLDRARRTLEETVPTPPSSLDMRRRGSAVRSGRKEIADRQVQQRGMPASITAGDVDVDLE